MSLDQSKPSDADVAEFNSVTSLVNSDSLTRTACKLVARATAGRKFRRLYTLPARI